MFIVEALLHLSWLYYSIISSVPNLDGSLFTYPMFFDILLLECIHTTSFSPELIISEDSPPVFKLSSHLLYFFYQQLDKEFEERFIGLALKPNSKYVLMYGPFGKVNNGQHLKCCLGATVSRECPTFVPGLFLLPNFLIPHWSSAPSLIFSVNFLLVTTWTEWTRFWLYCLNKSIATLHNAK